MDTILVERAEGVVTVRLNRPERKNAILPDMWPALSEIFLEVAARRADRVLVITGAGDGFCSGADLTDASGGGGLGGAVEGMRAVSNAALRLHELPKPTVAAVNGVAAGAGCNLALGCDLVLASDRARFSEIFMRRGMVTDFGGAWLLPRLVGLHRAKELVFLAEVVDAQRAAEIGIVNRVVPHATLADEATELAARLAAMPPVQLGVAKKLLNQSMSMSMAEALDYETIAQAAMFSSRDAAEAVLAFLEKREPHFTGE
jgi:enoyl-CoA hydratase/carnithine racemase